jgi:two-component system chemotaxis response regulator CheY
LKPDLIITDINMPNMGGLELIKNVKALPGFRFVPILTLTTESDASKRDEGKRLGATGWLVKPISGGDLLKVIKQVLPGT